MPEWVKIVEDVEMEWMYFAYEKDMNFVRLEGRMLWTDVCPPRKSDTEALIPNVMLFGDKALER